MISALEYRPTHLTPAAWPMVTAFEIPGGFTSALIQLLISAAFTGMVIQLLLLRQNRRKIEGEASASEATAASALTGSALSMVENAQRQATEQTAAATEARREANESRRETQRALEALTVANWRIYNLRIHNALLTRALEGAGITVPIAPDTHDTPTFPPPGVTMPNQEGPTVL